MFSKIIIKTSIFNQFSGNLKNNRLRSMINLKTSYISNNFSTFVIKNQQKMNHFQKTLNILNDMIARLQTNTGGQVKQGQKPAKVQKKVQQKPKVQQQKVSETKKQQKKEDTKPKEANKEVKKKQKKQTEKPAGKQPQDGGKVDPKFFSQVDIRIGEIVQCWKHPQSQNLYCQKINIGPQVREIASGLQKFVLHQNMKGHVLVMVNLKARPLAGFPSNGMVVCASTPDHSHVQLLVPQGQVGERVFLEGYQNLFVGGQVLPVLNPKRKVVEKCLEHFRTDSEGFVVWQGIKLRTKAGAVKAATVKQGNVG